MTTALDNLRVNTWWVPAIKHVSSHFGVDSLSRFPFIAWTNIHIHSQMHKVTPRLMLAWVITYRLCQKAVYFDGSVICNHVTLTFDPFTSTSIHAEWLPWSMRTTFGVDSSSRFSFRAWSNTQRHTKVTLTTHGSSTAGMGKYKAVKSQRDVLCGGQ